MITLSGFNCYLIAFRSLVRKRLLSLSAGSGVSVTGSGTPFSSPTGSLNFGGPLMTSSTILWRFEPATSTSSVPWLTTWSWSRTRSPLVQTSITVRPSDRVWITFKSNIRIRCRPLMTSHNFEHFLTLSLNSHAFYYWDCNVQQYLIEMGPNMAMVSSQKVKSLIVITLQCKKKTLWTVHVGIKAIVHKYLGNCQKRSVIKLILEVNKLFLLQLLGQRNCQTFLFLFYFGKMKLPISKTRSIRANYKQKYYLDTLTMLLCAMKSPFVCH